MRQLLITACLCFITFNGFSQFCGSDHVHGKSLRDNPILESQWDALEQQWARDAQIPKSLTKSPAPYTLPVVVHIIHNNGPENISDALAVQAIQDLNEAFANVGYYDPNTGVDTRIQFCLAQRTPIGAATNGITRNPSPLTIFDLDYQDITLKNLNRWDPLRYINIWVVRDICSSSYGCGVAGYAYFPTSHGRPEDGLVVEANYMGLTKANSSVLVHEMGHYLGLYHTFQDGCFNNNCSLQGDRVCDTPPDGTTAYSACNAPLNSCSTDAQSGFTSDQLDLISDYMDYSDLNCYSVFTAGQRDRMHFFIDNVRSSLVNNLSCVSPCPNPVIAGFTTPSPTVTIGTPVNFTNTSSGLTGTWSWRNNGTVFATTQNASQTFNTLGTYTIQLVANSSNSTCSADSFSVNITVICANPVVARFTTPSTTVNVGTLVNFTNTSSGNTGTWSWRNNRSVFATTQNASQTFNSPGTYTIQLLANSGNPNCPADSFSINITVICQNPVTARFTTPSTTVNIGTPVNFTNTSSGNTGTWSWRNNRSVFATTQNASQTFNFPGTYTIQLLANSGTPNCSADSFSVNITVICPNPVVARFTIPSTTVNVGTPVNFTNTSSGNTGTWSWRNNRSVFATTQNASQTFNSPGTYTIQLLAGSSTLNCPADSFSINITVVCPALVAGFTTPSTTVNVGTPVNFTNTSTGPVGNWSWRNNGTVFATTQNASQTFNTTGTYTIRLVANSSNLNCPSDSFSVNITAICPVQVSFTGPGTNLALNSAQTFISQTSNTTSLEWRVNNTIVGTGSSLTFNFTSQGVYEVCLIGRNGFCSQQWCNYYVAGSPSGTGCDGSMAKLFNRTNSLEQSKLIKASGDGNYYIAGRRGDSTFIMKVTQMGVTLWDRTFNFGIGEDFLTSMIIDSDLNIVGSGFANGSGTPYGFTYKYNPSLNSIIWNKQITTSSYTYDILEKTPGGNYILITYYDNAPAPGRNSDGGLLELNRNSGNATGISRQYNLFNSDHIQECIPYNNGYYAIGRVTSGGTFSTVRPYFSFFDANGNEVWSKSYFNNPSDDVRLYGKDGLIDNNALVMVVTGDFGGSNNYVTNNIGFLKTDINGNPLWSKRYTFPFSNVHPVQVANLPDGYLIAVTEYTNFNRFALLKTDKSGNVVWSKEYARNGGGMVGVYSNDIVVVEPNNLVFAPSVYANGTDWAYTFIKTDLNGNVNSTPCNIVNSITVTATTLPNYSLPINLIEYPNQCILTNATATPRNSATSSSNLCYTPCEVCNNGNDDDGDGLADCNDTDCCNFPTCTPPVLNIGNDILTCPQTGVTLDAGAGYLTYRWSNNTTNRTLVVNAAGTYRVTVTTACHTLTDAIQVTYRVPPTLELGPNITLCENGTRQITATPGFVSYQWNDGSTGNIFTAFRTGLVKVTATDACGGTQIDSVRVQIAVLFPFDLGRDTVICRPVSLRLQVPTVAGVTYSWYPNVAISCNNCASPTITSSVPTRYYVVVSNSNGCVGTDSILVTPNVCTVNVSITQRACLGTTLSVNGVSTTVPNTLTFNYTTTRGFDSIVTVRILPLDTFRTNVTLRACRGSNATFNGTPIPAGTTRSFRFTAINGCDSTVIVNVIALDTFRTYLDLYACQGSNVSYNGQSLPIGTIRIFNFSATNGCDSSVLVRVLGLPTSSVSISQSICNGQSYTFNGQTLTTTQTVTARLINRFGCDSLVTLTLQVRDTTLRQVRANACRGTNFVFDGVPIPAGGSRSFRYINSTGCDSIVDVTVTARDTFRLLVSPRLCQGQSYVLGSLTITRDTSICRSLTSQWGCDSIVCHNISFAVPGEVFQNVMSPTCFQSDNGRIRLSARGGTPPYHYYWTPILTDTSTVTGLRAGVYTVTITDAASCSVDFTFFLREPSLLQSNYQVTTVSCPGYSDGMVNISAFGGTSPYRYNVGSGPAVSDSLLRNLSAGRYMVTVSDDNDCTDTLGISLIPPSPLSINVWRDTVLNLGDTMQIRSAIVGIPPFGYAWSPSNGLSCDNCPEPVLTTDRSRVYTVIMTDARGCSTTDTLRVITLANNCAIYLPTAFTPNSDGYNDTWEPRFDYCVEGVVELAIFDRWGNNLYKSENIAAQGMIGWDGRVNGADLDSGVFVFMMRVRYNDGTVSGYINGDLTLLR